MLTSLKVETKVDENKTLSIHGEQAVRTYFDNIGTDNPKLKDQIGAFFKDKPIVLKTADTNKKEESSKPNNSRRSRRRGRRGRRPKK
jgi:hypothetical protein